MKPKIVLFAPKPKETYFYQGLPLPILAISGMLEREGYDLKLVKARAEHDYKKEVIDSCEGATILGVSVMTGCPIKEGLEISKAVREKYPNVKIVWGGWHPSLEPLSTIASPYVDIVCRGQGERTFYELVKHIESGAPLNDVLGITYKEGGEVITNPDRPIEDINNFPPLPYKLLNIEDYLMKTEMGSRTVNIITSAGCPHRCRFCAEPMVYKRKWTARKAESVVNDIEFFYRNYNIDSVFFNDNNFFVDEARIRDICKELIERGIKIKWGMANGRTERLLKYAPETWEIMKSSGCTSVLIGAESGSEKMLHLIQKDATVQDTIDLTKVCKSNNIRIYISLMTGLPPDPPTHDLKEAEEHVREELNATLDLIDTIYTIEKRHSIYLFLYTPYPGSPLYELSLKNGMKEPADINEWANFELNTKNTPWMPDKYVKIIDHLHNYIFPTIGGIFYDKIESNYTGVTRTALKSIARVFERIALFRWNRRFFSFPIEYKVMDFFLKWRKGYKGLKLFLLE